MAHGKGVDYPEASFLCYRFAVAGCPGDGHSSGRPVQIMGACKPLKFVYDGMVLKIFLDRFYTSKESYTVYIDYTAKPNDLRAVGSAAIIEAKGLYFINPKGTEKNKPIEVWTQGESQSSSAWFPTIDRPNQKTTEEIILTVPSKYVSLSNGKLISSKENGNGTRTDYWKMDLPHAPYLFFFGVGDYAIVKDRYKGKEVNYYVEKEYASGGQKNFRTHARDDGFLFQNTGRRISVE